MIWKFIYQRDAEAYCLIPDAIKTIHLSIYSVNVFDVVRKILFDKVQRCYLIQSVICYVGCREHIKSSINFNIFILKYMGLHESREENVIVLNALF